MTDPVSIAAWRTVGRRLGTLARRAPFLCGDWILYGEDAYDVDVDVAVELTGLDAGELIEMARVAQRFPDPDRRRALSFAHHAAVSELEPERADELLQEAERRRWSRARLEREVREAKRA